MYCPRCGQTQTNQEVKFCSRCGFLMAGLMQVVVQGGLPQAIIENNDPNAISPRKRGLKQGGLLFLSGFIIVPLLGLLTAFLNIEPFFPAIAAILTFLAGFLWMVYSLIFQSGVPTSQSHSIIETIKHDLTGKTPTQKSLPAQQTEPIPADFQPALGNWRETADLQLTSVTEETTRTLKDKTFHQNS